MPAARASPGLPHDRLPCLGPAPPGRSCSGRGAHPRRHGLVRRARAARGPVVAAPAPYCEGRTRTVGARGHRAAGDRAPGPRQVTRPRCAKAARLAGPACARGATPGLRPMHARVLSGPRARAAGAPPAATGCGRAPCARAPRPGSRTGADGAWPPRPHAPAPLKAARPRAGGRRARTGPPRPRRCQDGSDRVAGAKPASRWGPAPAHAAEVGAVAGVPAPPWLRQGLRWG